MKFKTAAACILLILCIPALCACGGLRTGEADHMPLDAPTGLDFRITEVGSAGARYVIRSDIAGEATCGSGSEISLQVQKNGVWYPLKKDYPVTAELWYIPSGNETEFTFYWYEIYGTLPTGVYRLVKTVSCKYDDGSCSTLRIGSEFTIG